MRKARRLKSYSEDRFVGLDIMLRNMAQVTINEEGDIIASTLWETSLKGIQRVNYYYEQFIEFISLHENVFYGVEDYAYGMGAKKSRSTFSIGEVSGTIKLHLYRARLPCMIFGIGQIKKFFTGKGNADKDMMINQAASMTHHIIMPDKKTHKDKMSHIADAYAIALMVRYYSTGIISKLNTEQVKWLEAHNVREFEL